MKATLTCLGCAALLASCAPTLTAPTLGRIVNAGTGQEGVVTFQPGTLGNWGGSARGGDNVTVQVGGQTYTGRAALLDVTTVYPRRPVFDLSLGFGSSFWDPASDWVWGGSLRAPATSRVILRTGNLIAKTAGPAPRTLTCNLQVDASEHGIGDCTGSDGARYAMQF